MLIVACLFMSSINSRSVRTTKTDKSKSLCSGGVGAATPELLDFDFSKELTGGHHTSLLWQGEVVAYRVSVWRFSVFTLAVAL